MKSSTKKRIKMVSFAILLVLLTMTIYCGKVEAADSLNCYVAKKYTGGDLEVGKTSFYGYYCKDEIYYRFNRCCCS